MKKWKPVFLVLAVVVAFACATAAEDVPNLTFKFKSVRVPKAKQTSIYGINNSGAMVGYYIDQKNAVHGLLLVNGEVTNIDDPKGTYGTEPNNVNSNGTIVGDYIIDAEGDVRSFSYQNGRFADVDAGNCRESAPCCVESAAFGINDSGEIVGFCTTPDNVVHGYLWNGGEYTRLDYPGANGFTLPWGINNAGLVTMQWIDSNGNYEGATYNSATQEYSAPITVPGAAQTYIHSINNAGDIVFSWYDSSGNSYGALLIGQDFYTFSDPKGPDYTRPDGINDTLDIVGRYEATGAKFETGFEATIKKEEGNVQLRGSSSPVTGAAGVAKSTQSMHPPSPRMLSDK